jgi:hypothetical protein
MAMETWINRSKVEQLSQEVVSHTNVKGAGNGLELNPKRQSPLYPWSPDRWTRPG